MIYVANKRFLKGEMVRNGDTNAVMAELLGISYATFSKKLNGNREFTQSEIKIIKDRYDLSNEEVNDIFFTLTVADKVTKTY